MAADDRLRVLTAAGRERERLVGEPVDVAVTLEPADHLVHRGCRELHRACDVGARDRKPGLLQPEHDLEVLLLGDRCMIVGHLLRYYAARERITRCALNGGRGPSSRGLRAASAGHSAWSSPVVARGWA